MQQRNGRLTFSPSDLSAFLACPHLTSLQIAVARGELAKPFRHNPHADLIRRKGDEHERAVLANLDGVVEISTDDGWDAAVRETEEAIRGGAPFIFQATFDHDGWRGRADFLRRLPDGTYEVLDTKLARHARPAHVLQLCFYTEQVARIQGSWPRLMHVVTGAGETESFDPSDYLAYYRRLKRRFAELVAAGLDTYPYPVEHCGLCEFLELCKRRWRADDHLTLVAGLSRLQFERLTGHGITTLERLGEAGTEERPSRVRPATYERLRRQAELQLRGRSEGRLLHELLPLEDERGFALLPEPSEGDVWLDLEGHPWFEPARGLEYLFGWVYLEDGEPAYRCEWAFDREGEREAFERFVDWIVERRRRYPGLHVYHYAAYERSALTRLMGLHGTREGEIDDLLRGEVLVDLYRVVRQGLRASVESYSLKEVEKLYAFERVADVGGGTESVVRFEEYQALGDQTLLDGIRDYNAEDCRSTYELHQWLLRLRLDGLAWRGPPEEREQDEEVAEHLREREELRQRLLAGAAEGEPSWLLSHLLEYHRREARPQWWEYFHHLGLDEEELFHDTDCIAEIELAGEPVREKQSLVYTLTFPAQEHKIGGPCVDPATGRGWQAKVDDAHGLITLRRKAKLAAEPLPRALIPAKPIGTRVQREAVLRFALDYERGGRGFPALRDVLERKPPRAELDGSPLDAALSLDSSYLFVQGPPGSGKTYTGARMAIALMRAGKRVGVTALSHKAIQKFLEDVRDAAREQRFEFKGRKKGDGDDVYEDEFVDSTGENHAMLDEELQLLAGTSWLFSREELQGHVDTLFIDEAGQFALADALAVGTSARKLILLGDPNQLPHVSQGTHPPGASASVLAHLLGDDETLRAGMGLFLEQTWRLRPEVCSFISDTFYEGRLHPAPPARERTLGAGHGVRYLPVEHSGNQQRSREEAKVVRAEIERLVGSEYVDERGPRRLGHADVIVVAPYNAHVRCLRDEIRDERIRIGTVDKFQGQEAPVVFYAMASSSADDVPRGVDFLFSRNRLNVAISRAKCLAYLVASPRLLDANCRTVEQMRLANALCRLVEVAT